MIHNRFNIYHNEAGDTTDGGGGTLTTHLGQTDPGAGTTNAGATGQADAASSNADSSGSAAASSTAATAQTAQTPAAAPIAATRPEWFPEKYWKDGSTSDVETLAKSYGELQKAFSSKNPHLAEVPADPAGYSFKPDTLPEGVQWSDEVASKMSEVFHKAQIGNTQAKAIAAAFTELEAANLAAATKVYEDKLTADREALAAKWGGQEAYNSRQAELAAFVSEKLGEDPNDPTLFANPRIVEFIAKEREYVTALEKQLGEDALTRAKGAIAPGSTFSSAPDEAQRIMNDPNHPDNAAWLNGDPDVQKKVFGLLGASQ